MDKRSLIKSGKRWVVKVGSALLTDDGRGLNVGFIAELAEQMLFLREQGIETILVSSGSVAAGMSQLGMVERPERVSQLQAAAAVGQASLVRHYEEAFQPFGINIAQVLLTHADIADRARYLNARSTLVALLELGVLTVINENDTVATEEICFGDNDNLAALVTNLVEADLLVILTDQEGLFTADPRTDQRASLVSQVDADDPTLLPMASGGSRLGRGGMVTKLTAGQSASRSGASTVIANGRRNNVLSSIFNGDDVGTLLRAKQPRLSAKKQWMAGQMKIKGTLTLDDGAVSVVQQSGRSILPVGVARVTGDFKRGELLSCVDSDGLEIARGLSNYSSVDAKKIIGQPSDQLKILLEYGGDDELIHRDNLVLLS